MAQSQRDEFPLLTNCQLTINSKVVGDTGKLFKLLTNELKFKIVGCDPLIIEKHDPSQVDIGKVFDGIRSLCKVKESREIENQNVQCNVHDVTNSTSLSQTGHKIEDHCQLASRSNRVNSKDVTQERSCKENGSNSTAVCENFSLPYKENIISEINIPCLDTDKVKQTHRVDRGKEDDNKLIEITDEQGQRESKLPNEILLNFATTEIIKRDANKQTVNESAAEYLTQMSNYKLLDQAKMSDLPNKDVEFKQEVLLQDIYSSVHHSASKISDNIESVTEWYGVEKDDTKDMNNLSLDNKVSTLLHSANMSADDHLLVWERDDNESEIIKDNRNNEIASKLHQTVSLVCNTSNLYSNLDLNGRTDKQNVEKINVEEQSHNIQQGEKSTVGCSAKLMKSADQQIQQEESENTYFPEIKCETNNPEEMCMLIKETSKTEDEDMQNYNKCKNISKHDQYTFHAENENYTQFQEAPEVHITTLSQNMLGDVCMLKAGCEKEFHKQMQIQNLKQTKCIKEYKFELEKELTEERQSGRSEHSEDINSSSLLLVSDIKSDSKSGYCVVSKKCKLNIQIYQANITELQVDCIVNAANENLKHMTDVAKAISDAAGPTLRKECNNYTKDGRVLDVTGISVSTSGKLPAKYVIHVVGPYWDDYAKENKHQCCTDLRQTVMRCLVEANRCRATSIALPSINAAIFTVPKELSARCYMEAVKHFDVLISDRGEVTLQEIHFVDVDATMVDILVECFSNNWSKESDFDIVLKDAEFVDQHLKSASENEIKNHHSLSFEETKCANDISTLYSALTEDVVGAAAPITSQPLADHVSSTQDSSSRLRKDQSDVSQSVATLKMDQSDVSQLATALKRDQSHGSQSAAALKRDQSHVNQSNAALKRDHSHVIKSAAALSDETCEISATYQLGKITLHVDSRHAFDLKSDVTFTMGKPFDKLSGTPDFSISTSLKLCENVCCKENKYTYFNVSQLDGSQSRYLCEVFPEPDKMETAVEAFKNLRETTLTFKKLPETLIITSNVLYADPSNMQLQTTKKNYIHVKTVGMFAVNLYNYLDELSKYIQEDIRIFVVGSEDSLPIIVKVIESHNIVKMVLPHAAATVQTVTVCDFCGQSKSVEPVACCGKWLCEDCEQIASSCPFCLKLRKIITGNQPPGLMRVALIDDHADGYENISAWKIEYFFPDGIQKKCHPHPGKPYASITRTAYLPDNDHGYQVLLRLRLAFIRNLIFTIGFSDSRNKDDVIVWDGISHKTSLHGGKKHGYPDADYLSRVTLELAHKGVHVNTSTTSEKQQLSDFNDQIKKFNRF